MKNYGEELSHWYLRLNGFFIIDDFVIHREVSDSVPKEYSSKLVHSSDADLLAVRLPYTFEKINNEELNIDYEFFKKIGIRLDKNNKVIDKSVIGIICEVKTGRLRKNEDHFKIEHIDRALGRLGLIPSKYIRRISPDVKAKPIVSSNDSAIKRIYNSDYEFKIVKVLFSADEISNDQYITIPLQSVEKFITDRLYKYGSIKYGDRMLFPSSLIQYLCWGATIR